MKVAIIVELCAALIISNFFIFKAEYPLAVYNSFDFCPNDQMTYGVHSDIVGAESGKIELPGIEPECGDLLNSIQSWQLSQQCL